MRTAAASPPILGYPQRRNLQIDMEFRTRRGNKSTSGEDGADALGGAFQQVAQGLVSLQEALPLQQQSVRRFQEALVLQEQRAATALREAVRQMQQERDQAIRALREEFTNRIQRLEDRMTHAEEQIVICVRGSGSDELGEGGMLQQLEGRMENLEAAAQKALSTVFPRVDALVAQLGESSPPEVSGVELPASLTSFPTISSPNSFTSTSRAQTTSTSGSIASVHSNAVSTSSRPRAADAEGATAPRGEAAGARVEPVSGHRGAAVQNEQRARQRVQLRIRDVEARMEKVKTAPDLWGEELCRACWRGTLETVHLLLDSGADVNYSALNGNSPLMGAVSGSDPDVALVSLLLERGALVDAANCVGWTALHRASSNDRRGHFVALLIGAGSNVDARDGVGMSPLHCAAGHSNEAGVRALLAAGAARNPKGWSGYCKDKTPFDMATTDAVRDLLRQ